MQIYELFGERKDGFWIWGNLFSAVDGVGGLQAEMRWLAGNFFIVQLTLRLKLTIFAILTTTLNVLIIRSL